MDLSVCGSSRWAVIGLLLLVAGGHASPVPLSTDDLSLSGALSGRPDGAIQLTSPPAGASDQNPAYSPEGSRIVFTRFDHGYNDGPAGLFVLAAGSSREITPVEDQDNVNLPGTAWNATRDRIVFASDREEVDEIWWIAPDGSDLHRVTEHAGSGTFYEPTWSPDGDWICFEVRSGGDGEEGVRGEIWKVRVDGSGAVALTSGGTYDDRQPNWSPIGDWIVFQRRDLDGGPFHLITINPAGGSLFQVTDGTSDDTDASWSPDGEWIVYSSDRGKHVDLWVVSRLGGPPTMATDDPNPDGAASWSPDGRQIAFESHAGEDVPAAIWQIEAPNLQRWFLAGMAHTRGFSGSTWRSDLWIVNRSSETVDVTLTTTAMAAPAQHIDLPGEGSAGWSDVLVELFELDDGTDASGSMNIAAPVPLAIVARTYNLGDQDGTYGQQIPAISASDGVRAGETAIIPGLDVRGAFRVNVGALNLGSSSLVATFRLINAAGALIDTKEIAVDSGQWLQANDVLAGRTGIFYAEVEINGTAGMLWAYASVIDKRTADATLIPMQRLE